MENILSYYTIWHRNHVKGTRYQIVKFLFSRRRALLYFSRLHALLKKQTSSSIKLLFILCLEASCKVDQITSVKRLWFLSLQETSKQWIITQTSTH